MTHDVFISHVSHDRDVADAACIALEQRGFRCWVAPRDLLAGEDRDAAIDEAIRGSGVFLAIFSAASAEAPQARRAAEQAADRGLPIVAFRIADVEQSLGAAHWVDALTPPIAPHLDYLGDTVADLIEAAQRGPLTATAPPGPFPRRRRAPSWLPIALAGAAGVVAIALAAAYVGSKAG
jgi:hypothetical protein